MGNGISEIVFTDYAYIEIIHAIVGLKFRQKNSLEKVLHTNTFFENKSNSFLSNLR